MKVVILSHSSAWEHIGGAELSILQTIRQWRELDPDVEISVVARGPSGLLQVELAKLGVPATTIEFDAWVLPQRITAPEDVFRTQRANLAAVKTIVKMLRMQQTDLVITNTIISPWAAIAAALAGVPHVWMVREFGDLDHGHQFQIGQAETFGDIARLSALVVANSTAVKRHLENWIDPGKISVAYPAIDVQRLESQSAHPLPIEVQSSGLPRVVMVGRLAESKGQWRLVRAVGELRRRGVELEVLFVGHGEAADKERLVDEAQSAGVSDLVTFTGPLENPFPVVRTADITVMASTNEAFGRSTLEYMLLGRAVIAPDVGGSAELLVDGRCGVLFDVSNPASLEDALLTYATDPLLRASHGAAAAKRARALLAGAFTTEVLIAQLTDVAASQVPRASIPHVVESWLDIPAAAQLHFDSLAAQAQLALNKSEEALALKEEALALKEAAFTVLEDQVARDRDSYTEKLRALAQDQSVQRRHMEDAQSILKRENAALSEELARRELDHASELERLRAEFRGSRTWRVGRVLLGPATAVKRALRSSRG
ncbi:glycosyltransferase [Salinibacterium sp. ZJ454]|uniref:glycosyltransferase n=1 Tax=Salinibacterium sp. ZJ454 TaxID=2708339 RepID=UPI001424179D|nr:glycosyltransferase [Salinibacterium sp. ZJ454]